MHATVKHHLILQFIVTSITICITATAAANSSSSLPAYEVHTTPSFLPTILSTLGFQDLSVAALEANLSTTTPITIFAPSDSSLLTCPRCSHPLLLLEHSLRGLYPLHFLRSLAFGTKIETLAPNCCLTVTPTTTFTESTATKKIFINGIEITKPDLFNDGVVIVHGLQGFVSHLSADSCKLTTPSYPTQPPPLAASVVMHNMLQDAMTRLRVSGYSLMALAMRVNYGYLSELKALTVFALDDASIFAGGIGHAYVADIGFHIVPNRLLMGSDFVVLPPGTALPTMKRGKKLVVTTAGGRGPLPRLRINYIKIKIFDLVANDRIVVHGLSTPFPHVELPTAESESGNNERSRSEIVSHSGFFKMVAQEAGIQSTGEVEDYHGL